MSLHSIVNNPEELRKSFERHLSRHRNAFPIQPSVGEPDVTDISRKVIIDLEPADGGKVHTQDEWHTYWNRVTDGRIMAALSDYYHATKQIMYNRDHHCETDLDRKLLASIQKDFQKDFICCDDRLIYRTTLKTQVISHYSSKDENLRLENNFDVKGYQRESFTTALDDPEIFKLMQFLCRTNDEKDELIKTFISMSCKTKKQLCFRSTPVMSRVLNSLDIVFLGYGGGRFRIGVDGSKNRFGYSRGVRYV